MAYMHKPPESIPAIAAGQPDEPIASVPATRSANRVGVCEESIKKRRVSMTDMMLLTSM